MALVVSDDLLPKDFVFDEAFLVDLACFLYDKRRLSMGKASKLAGMHQLEFQRALMERDIYLNYTEEDIDVELRNVGLT